MRIGLVGCVKQKRDTPAPARDLYTSPLFRGARAYVDATCDDWWVLSAEHGLIDPDRPLAPYDRTLATAGRRERERWAAMVLTQIDAEIGAVLDGATVEVHAGMAYHAHGLTAGLAIRGATVELPLDGLSLGHRLRWYAQHRPDPFGS